MTGLNSLIVDSRTTLARPDLADALQVRFSWLHRLLVNKYYFDWFNENVIARLSRALGG